MTIYEFLAMDEMEQAEALWEGVLIGERFEPDYKIILYQIAAFYVEVFYHAEHNVIKRFRSFKTVDQLGPYLDTIDLDKLT